MTGSGDRGGQPPHGPGGWDWPEEGRDTAGTPRQEGYDDGRAGDAATAGYGAEGYPADGYGYGATSTGYGTGYGATGYDGSAYQGEGYQAQGYQAQGYPAQDYPAQDHQGGGYQGGYQGAGYQGEGHSDPGGHQGRAQAGYGQSYGEAYGQSYGGPSYGSEGAYGGAPTYGTGDASYGTGDASYGTGAPYGSADPSYGSADPSYGSTGTSYGSTATSYGSADYGSTDRNAGGTADTAGHRAVGAQWGSVSTDPTGAPSAVEAPGAATGSHDVTSVVPGGTRPAGGGSPTARRAAERGTADDSAGSEGAGSEGAGRAGTTAAAGGARRTRPGVPAARGRGGAGARAGGAEGRDYDDEEFDFVDDESESEDVIDWLAFAETRSERRDERRRQARLRLVALVVVGALVLLGGGGYLLWNSRGDGPGGAPADRDVLVLHLRDLDGLTSTALLVDDPAGDRGTVVLLPDALTISDSSTGVTSLGASLDSQGAGGTRDALSDLIGVSVDGTWRLDTPFLEVLVDAVGGIDLEADVEVRGVPRTSADSAAEPSADPSAEEGAGSPEAAEQVLVPQGPGHLDGYAAVAYATYQAPGEDASARLARFGRVMAAVFAEVPQTTEAAGTLVRRLGVPDPSLPDDELAAAMVALGGHARDGRLETVELPAADDGTLQGEQAAEVVRDVLGGAISNAEGNGLPRVTLRDASGDEAKAQQAQVELVNAGYTFVPGGGTAEEVAATTEVLWTDPADEATARQVAGILGLGEEAARRSEVAQTADVLVVLGQDYAGAAGE
ncbi:LytR C-terminal domain-containing protein [Allostreptomyces psammosilenae]|uniref:LytR/CpsA/Psr regulator C-terminal domain-containing protein n=1 Tax=Allostreptomyces psammosilenae TaxID=1892865 RepID=A0A852ZXY8_9ACTN|nr:LytR C-terminal domain-containing protein [Allostreptomyces psammosilenae]NYI06647.1 hypothetical protein [Allostreptomyces psammosilenae]